MRGIIEGFEGDYAIIEIDGETRDVDRSAVQVDAEVGDCVVLREGTWMVDSEATQERARYMKKLMEDVWND